MSAPILKPLSKGKCLQDLKPHYDKHEYTNQNIFKLCKSAPKLFQAAKDANRKGNQEDSYIYFMKYLSIISYVQKSDEYKRKKSDIDKELSRHSVLYALETAEKLSKCLEERYRKADLIKPPLERVQPKQEAPEEIVSNPSSETIRKPDVVNEPSLQDVGMSCMQLCKILEQNPSNVVIMDVRPQSCFNDSHIMYDSCISVPEEILQPGCSASKLAEKLPVKSQSKWRMRLNVEHLILLDWASTTTNLQPDSAIHRLQTIILEWDPAVEYRSKPVILNGGFTEWWNHYPMYCTNPKPQLPPQTDDGLLDIDDVVYPELVDETPKFSRASKPIPKVNVAFSSGNAGAHVLQTDNAEILVIENGKNIDVNNATSSRFVKDIPSLPKESRTLVVTVPSVDRTSKLAAVQKYKELEDKREEVIQHSQNLSRDRESAEIELKEIQVRQGRNELTDREKESLYQNERKLKLRIKELHNLQRSKEEENEALRKELEEYRKRDQSFSYNEDADSESPKSHGIPNSFSGNINSELEAKLTIGSPKPTPSSVGTYNMDLAPPPSSSLKRSRSSPNIAQLGLEPEQKPPMPHFDRNTKPSVQKPQTLDFINRHRNFNEVYGTVKSGLTGLKNLGNSCYMNSVLQCISNIGILNNYFCRGKYKEHLNQRPDNPTRGEVAEEVAHVIRNLWLGQYRSIACRDFKGVVGKYMDRFRGCSQQDAHEFLTFLMDWLHNDLKLQKEHHLKEATNFGPKNSDTDAVTGAINAWNEFKSKHESVMLTSFFIQQVSTVQCSSCSVKSMNYEEPTSNLTLLLPSAARCTLSECLRLYTSKERISGYKCESCHGHHDAEKYVDLCRLPPILIIHLKRFYSDGFYQKRQTFVDFPLENLDMRNYTPNKYQPHTVYDLCGVSNHYGTLEGGHYTAYCKNGAKWYKFDDQDVNEISRDEVKSANAYILFYAAVK